MEGNKKKIYMIVLTCVTVFCVIFGVAYHVMGWVNGNGRRAGIWPWSTSKEENTDTVSLEGEVTSLTVDSDCLSVIIETGENPSITYTLPENADPKIEQKDGTLKITCNYKGNLTNWSGTNASYEMVVTLPEDTKLGRLEAILDAGNLELYGIDIDEITVEMDAGNMEVYDAAITYLEAKVDMGNLELHESSLGDGKIEADMGNVEIEGSVSALTASVDMGNLEIISDRDVSEMDLDISCDLGSCTVNGKNY